MKALWIRVEAHEIDSIRVAQLAEALGCSAVTALGHLVALGGQVAEQTPEGQIATVSNAMLERWGRWEGKRELFARAVRELLQDGDGYLDDWRESMGKLVERRIKDRLRKERGKPAEIPPSFPGFAEETVRDSAATKRDGTEREKEEEKDPAFSGVRPAEQPTGIAPGANLLAAGELVQRIRGLARAHQTPHGTTYVIRPADVEQLGPHVLRAFHAVGGAARFLAATGKDIAFLNRDFRSALGAARAQASSGVPR